MRPEQSFKYYYLKIRNRLSVKKNRLWKYCNVERVSMFGYVGFADSVSVKVRLNEICGKYSKKLFENVVEADSVSIVASAEQAFNHVFDLLGSGPIELDPIDWHTDFLSGHSWPKGLFYKDYNVDIDTKKVDGKVPWELSRCHHLLWLGEAYGITGEEKYAEAIVSDIGNWIDENPLMHSVNWTCSMDVAIRAVNWLYALWLISDSTAFTDSFARKVSKSFFQHGFFIKNNLERIIPYSNNHYAADLVGLLYIGAFFNSTNTGKYWFKFATRELFNEVDCQILPSGAHYERSVSYHRLMVELFSSSYYMWKRYSVDVPVSVERKISRMYTFVFNYLKPNGKAPLIEDNDDGRFLPFVKRDFRDHSYLLDQNSLEIKLIANGNNPLYYELRETSYADVGHWIFRNHNVYAFFTNGGQSRHQSNSTIVTTHTHNDLLSFELALGEDDLIIDPGTYRYVFSSVNNPDGRNEFRSTMKHNTIMVDGEEQHELSETQLFVIRKNAVIDADNIYHTLSGLKHKRTLDISEDGLIINDYVEKQGSNHTLKSFFHFANDVMLRKEDREVFFETRSYHGKVSFPLSVMIVNMVKDTVSPSYGKLINSQTVEASTVFDDMIQISTIITWKRK